MDKEIIIKDFQEFLEEENIKEITKQDVDNYIVGLYYSARDYDELEYLPIAEHIIISEFLKKMKL